MNRTTTLLALVVLGAATSTNPGIGDQAAPKKAPNAFMKLKLQNAQLALDGIALANFSTIETSATALVQLSRKAEFQLMKTEEYARQSEQFRRSAESLRDAAQAKNLDAAALAYVGLTLNCVSCHKYLRLAR